MAELIRILEHYQKRNYEIILSEHMRYYYGYWGKIVIQVVNPTGLNMVNIIFNRKIEYIRTERIISYDIFFWDDLYTQPISASQIASLSKKCFDIITELSPKKVYTLSDLPICALGFNGLCCYQSITVEQLYRLYKAISTAEPTQSIYDT